MRKAILNDEIMRERTDLENKVTEAIVYHWENGWLSNEAYQRVRFCGKGYTGEYNENDVFLYIEEMRKASYNLTGKPIYKGKS